jgi:tRNA1(Val) A37 N6-methylase TrmN6
MSIYSLNLSTFKQDFECKPENKEIFGEVSTDFILVNKILNLLPQNLFENPKLKWLDPCAGKGYFSIVLYKRLFKSLQTEIQEPRKRHHHIIQNMIYMVELNPCHLSELYKLFGENANILNANFLEMSNMQFDIIVGNPPFNANGVKKVPTNNKISKKKFPF